MKMDKRKIIQIVLALSVLVIFILGFVLIKHFGYYVDDYRELSLYYKIFGDTEKSTGYKFIANVFRYFEFFILSWMLLIGINAFKVNMKGKYDIYPRLLHDYRGYYHFKMTSILVLFNFYFVTIYFDSIRINKEGLFILFFLYVLLTDFVGNKMYNHVNKKTRDIKNSEVDFLYEEDTTFKEYKIIKVFYIFLMFTVLTFSFTTYQIIRNKEYLYFPDQLVINDDYSKVDSCRKSWNFAPYDLYLFSTDKQNEFYTIKEIKILINSEDSMALLDDKDYEIFIIYNNEKFYLTEEDFTLNKSDEKYEYQINIENYLNNNNIKRDRFQRVALDFVDANTKESITEISVYKYLPSWNVFR